MTNIEKIATLGNLLSKKYGMEVFKLIAVYKDISASEASSRLGLHIQTVQEFLESTTSLGLTSKKEVVEKKRPYFRYSLIKKELNMQFKMDDLIDSSYITDSIDSQELLLREQKKSNSHFTVARAGEYFSTISVLVGEGRGSKQKKINLTIAQGKFLYHLPFPNATPLSIEKIMTLAQVDYNHKPEIENIVLELINCNVIESVH